MNGFLPHNYAYLIAIWLYPSQPWHSNPDKPMRIRIGAALAFTDEDDDLRKFSDSQQQSMNAVYCL